MKYRFVIIFWAAVLLASCGGQKKYQGTINNSKEEVLSIIHKVNNYWQVNNKPEQRSFWDVAAYYTGN